MKKFKSIINSVPGTTLILFLICVIVTAALAGTNFITKDRITKLNIQAEKDAMAEVIPASLYENGSVKVNGQPRDYVIAKNGEEILGYIVTTVAQGYGGEIKVMAGVDPNGDIINVRILAADDETPGLGAKVKNKDFYNQYIGKSSGVGVVKNSPAENDIIAVTGATISSTAVNTAVNEAVAIANNVSRQNIVADTTEQEAE
jgi:electron transport complex protein RnfG